MVNRTRQNQRDGRIVHCLLCHKPQACLSSHLSRVCMKNKPPRERLAELQRAKDSLRAWTYQGRNWDYNKLCELIPDKASRMAFVQRLQVKSFFVVNAPNEADMRDAEQPSTSAAASGALEAMGVGDTSGPGDLSADILPEEPSLADSLDTACIVKQVELYEAFPSNSTILLEFKTYLIDYMKIPDYQESVDNVSRMLRYLQPTGANINVDFLTRDLEIFKRLRILICSDLLLPVTKVDHMTSLIRFFYFLRSRNPQDLEFKSTCDSYISTMDSLRQPRIRFHNRAMYRVRCSFFYGATKTLTECQKVLNDGKSDMLGTVVNLQKHSRVSEEDKALFRYYCEAILVLGHLQTPKGVEGMTASQWCNKSLVKGRVCVGVSQHKPPTMQIALTTEESAMLEAYYLYVRPDCDDGKFFIKPTGEPISSATDDISSLHDHYNLPNVTSQDIRKAVEAESYLLLKEEQRGWMAHYMADSPPAANTPHRMKTQEDVVATANMLSSLALYTCVEPTTGQRQRGQKRARNRRNEDNGKNFAQFLEMFPVRLFGLPPNKIQRADAGFSERTCFYKKWKAVQLEKQEEDLLLTFCRSSPSVKKVKKNWEERWFDNHPCPERIVAKWRPAKKCDIETNEDIMKRIQTQKWSGVSIKDYGENGRQVTVVATRAFGKGSILCDFHGELITAEEGKKILESAEGEKTRLFFFSSGSEQLCIDAQTHPCQCHSSVETVGRKMKHSRKNPNVKPLLCKMRFSDGEQDTVLLVATRDIAVDQELRFDHGAKRKSYRGEGLDLEWREERAG